MNAKKTLGLFALSAMGLTALAGCNNGSSSDDPNGYTYNTYLSTSPSKWNVHSWETSDESYIQGFTEVGLYDAVMSANKKGYKFISEMASGMPKAIDPSDLSDEEYDDISDKYYNDGNLSTGTIWEIPLRKSATWEDGTAITANDYVQSMERLLNPKYANYRADSYYNGSFVIANAENYYKNGRQVLETIFQYLTRGKVDGNLYDEKGNKVDSEGKYYLDLAQGESAYGTSYFSSSDDTITFYDLLNSRSATGSDTLEAACQRITLGVSYYYWKFGNAKEKSSNQDKWDEIDKSQNPSSVSKTMLASMKPFCIDEFDNNEVYTNKTYKNSSLKDESNRLRYTTQKLKDDLKIVVSSLSSSSTWAGKTWAWKIPLSEYITQKKTGITMSDVGIEAKDDYTLRLYLTKKISELDLKFQLSSNWLVKTDLYDSLTKKTTSSSWMTSYGSGSKDNYLSYGPYKLTSFVADQAITIERNDKWYGYTDEDYKKQFSEYTGDLAFENQYKLSKVYTRIIKNHDTAVSEFMAGNLDDIDLNKNDMKIYGNSTRRITTLESYTQKLSFNTDWAKLASRQEGNGKNKTALSNFSLRKGLSLGLDRNSFASQTTAGSQAFTGLLNSLYLSNNVTGEMYRDTEQGKSVYNKIYGELGGEPTDKTTSALSESANGYNYSWAKHYVKKGLVEELTSKENGHLAAGDTIDIEFRVYDNTTDTTKEMATFINTAWTQLLKDACDECKKWASEEDSSEKELDKELSDLLGDKSVSIKVNAVKDEDYYTTARNGGADMIFSIWGGAAIDPYHLMQVYLDKTFTNCCEYGFKGKQDDETLWIDLDNDGVEDDGERETYDAWYHTLTDTLTEGGYSDEVKVDDTSSLTEEQKTEHDKWLEVHNKRLAVLAGTEAGIVNRYEAVPMVARGTSSLNGFKVENASKTYINLIGYGGIRFMQFNYTNSEWSSFVNENGGNLADVYAAYRG